MLKGLFLIIILIMCLLHIFDNNEIVSEAESKPSITVVQDKSLDIKPYNSPKDIQSSKKQALIQELVDESHEAKPRKIENLCSSNRESFANTSSDEIDIKTRKPWSRITLNELDEFPYRFFIKAKIPSLNDYQNWRQVVPNLDFNPKSGELIIPSKDEPSALALANLIIINFLGQLTLQDILEKNLIQISVNKAKNYEMVQTKLREQINDNLYGKTLNKVSNDSEYDQDLAKNIDFKSEKFADTFEHFGNNSNLASNEISAYQGGDFSYL